MISPLLPLFFLMCHIFAIVGSVNDEGLALLSFKQSVGNPTDLANWNASDVNPCSWHGIQCRENKVDSLTIPNRNLSGFLPPALGNLSSLRRLNLKNNQLVGSLPVELFNAKGLQSLVLSGNSFSGPLPAEIGKLKFLQSLDISQNSFNGSIPLSLINCRKLRILNLSWNSLSGPIPSDMGTLSRLQSTLDLSHNLFSGHIPASLGSLPEVVYIDLSFNNLSGPIPQNGTLIDVGPTAFIGNPLLCGPPLRSPCPNSNDPSLIDNLPKFSRRKHNISNLYLAAMIVAGTMVALCLVVLLFSYWYKKDSSDKGVDSVGGSQLGEKLKRRRGMFCFARQNIDTLSENLDQCSFVPLDLHVDFDLEQLLIASAFLLGKSDIGIVYKVVLSSRPPVVVRRLGDGGGQRYKEFQTEVEAIGKIRHPNIVSLRAYCCSADEKLLIYEYIPNGDLAAAIHGKSGSLPFKPLSWTTRVKMMKGIAKGLAYLHELSPKRYVHGNLKPSNILLGENMEAHISDFGLARLANLAEDSLAFQGELVTCRSTPRSSPYEFTLINSSTNFYQAPEASKATRPSQKWDVYSFGVILLEMISGKPPTCQMGSSETDLVQWIQLCIEERKPLACILDPFLARDWEKESTIAATMKIALACIDRNPDKRPTMRYVSDNLDKLISNS